VDKSFNEDGWRVRKDGFRFWANEIIIATRNDSGQVTGLTVIVRDLREQKRAGEAIMAHSEEMKVSNEALRRLNGIMEGRELRMIKLKREVNKLLREAGQPELYPLNFMEE